MRTPSFVSGPRAPLTLALICAAALPIGGCARTTAKADVPYVARDVGTLYSTARNRLDQSRYKEAAILFDEVERQHPYSIWARRAQLMSAFSYYLDKNYTQSIQSAQRFLSVHPGNRDAPYAYYLIALGYYEQIQDVTRDQKITRQALDALGELVRRYPNTRYASDARLKIDLVNDHLAGKEMEVGRFYEVRGQWLGASMRFRTVVEQYQQTTHTPEALMRLTEAYLALGVPEEAQKAAAVLGRNYPGSDWYQQAFKLMKDNPVKQVAAIPLGQPIVPAGTPGAQPGSLPGDAGTGTAPNAAPPQTTTGANPTRGTQPTN
ncbi:MAG: outer membrane protein assembly factor BamD [Sphingomonas sp.]|jgi:outer membrane protein assembly factor BamD|uniref:Outer membrane protein assembly factor BamD n=1 Tax=Sphingomonas longa TaxID=2778730 RepID=A0ABS2D5C2_9SPHN|nr:MULTISPECIES: outer membrane protein assembly factor BamD [Alphaproteobacteria]MBM6576116.1 outer membrane protein assembly factor BamD [Sphingomonas sp. BT552]MBR7709161.1 outer membrane protein assembly factor BamD [Microvirga sp. SRT01]RZM31106.1 MAG: outer membrane protein assembly factor BamD [Sphingomonas sp.]